MYGIFLALWVGISVAPDTLLITILQNGTVTATAVGEATAVATSDGVTATRKITVTEQFPVVATVDVNIHRLDSKGGVTLVSAGVPLRAGLVYPNTVERFRLVVNNVEIPIFVEPLFGKHEDGSYRSILVQFPMELTANQTTTGRLEFGPIGIRQGTRTTIVGNVESAVILPASSAYILSTQVVPPTTLPSQLPSTQLYTRFDMLYQQYATFHAITDNLDAVNPDGSRLYNFYDRVLNAYTQWIRTGNIQYWIDATRLARQYARITAVAPWNFDPDGLFVNYLLTGNQDSRAMLAWATRGALFNLHAAKFNYTLNAYRDGRGQQRHMLGALYSAILEDNSANWLAAADEFVVSWLDTQEPYFTTGMDGAWIYPLSSFETVGQSNFMEGLRVSALVTYLELRNPPASIRQRVEYAIKQQVDFLWNTQWQPQFQSFKYWSSDEGGSRSLADLNNLMVLGFAYVFHLTGDEVYRERSLQIMSQAFLQQPDGFQVWWSGGTGKWFNQNYYSSPRVFYYLNSVRQ